MKIQMILSIVIDSKSINTIHQINIMKIDQFDREVFFINLKCLSIEDMAELLSH
jgi:hypothetical protein